MAPTSAERASGFDLPRLQPTAADIAVSRERLHTHFPASRAQRLVLVYPSGGALPIRAWPMAHYQAFCNALLAQNFAVGIIGLESDRALSSELVERLKHPSCQSLAGYTASVRELVTLFHHAELLVSNDGGPGHFAAMANLPTLMFFGPETPRLYSSLSPKVVPIHLASMPCSPCLTAFNHRKSPCDGDNQCLKQITPEQVLAMARPLLDSNS